MAKLIWSPQALQDLHDICQYIARDSKQYASLFAERIVALVESIPLNPELGALVPEFYDEEVRERHFQKYRVIYAIMAGASRWSQFYMRLGTCLGGELFAS